MTELVKAALLEPKFGIFAPIYRELRPLEHYLLRDHLLRLGKESRVLRFCGTVSDQLIEYYCNKTDRPTPIICGAFVGDMLRGVVELRFDRSNPRNMAELAISVEDKWQETGLGTRLMELAFRCARDNGIDRVEVNFLPHNVGMRRLALKFGAHFSHQMGLTKGIFTLTDPGHAVIAGSKRPQ